MLIRHTLRKLNNVAIVIPAFFDYASTLCYVAWRIVTELEHELGVTILWKGVPIQWRDRRARPGKAYTPRDREKILSVVLQTGVRVTPPECWLESTPALQGAEFAREAGAFEAFHAAVFRAAFEQRRDIGDRKVLLEIASGSGLDVREFEAALATCRYENRLRENKAEADRFGALGYPTFLLGEFPLIGIQPKATMRLLFERFIELRRQEPTL